MGAALARKDRQCFPGGEVVDKTQCRAARDRVEQRSGAAADMKERHGAEESVAGSHPHAAAHRGAAAQQLVLAKLDALGEARRAGGVLNDENVVVVDESVSRGEGPAVGLLGQRLERFERLRLTDRWQRSGADPDEAIDACLGEARSDERGVVAIAVTGSREQYR